MIMGTNTIYILFFFPRKKISDVFFLPIFDLKKMISTYTKDFSWKKKAQIHQISKKNNSKSPDFYHKFQ
jgi:hypothetical protein